VTDPLGNVSSQSLDAAGRVIVATDPQGNTTKYQYNNLNLLTQATDTQGHNTAFAVRLRCQRQPAHPDRSLEPHQIDNFRKLLEECEREHGLQ
jgi:YD repeat-containing protein